MRYADDDCVGGDSLESELRALHPLPLGHRVQRAISRKLPLADARRKLQVRRSLLARVSMASALTAAAACIALALFRPVRSTPDKVVKAPTTSEPAINVATDAGQFAIAAYRQASAISAGELDSMLDRQAIRSSGLSAEFGARPIVDLEID